MNKWMTMMGLVLVVGFFAPICLAQEEAKPKQIDNPEYANWAAFKAGAMCKSKTVLGVKTRAGKMTIVEMTNTMTLKEITAEKAVVEMVVVTKMKGNETKMPPQSREVPAKIDKPTEPSEPSEKPKVEIKEGEEEITVAAGTFKCKTSETTTTANGKTTVAKIWTCEKVPGKMVKMTSETTGGATTSMELLEYKTGA